MKQLILFFFAPLLTLSQTYNFDTDLSGITQINGTARIFNNPTQGNVMEATAFGANNIAVFDLDLFPSSSNYSVIWKETYTTNRRHGFILRGNGSNSRHSGLKQGYLFQSNTNSGDVRIYRSNSNGYTQLGTTTALEAPGVNTPRWFRASVEDNSLDLDYSDDGITFTNLLSVTDATYTTGETQYAMGYTGGVGGTYVDDITYNEIVTPSVRISNISAYQVFQRDDLGNASIFVEGNYVGTPTAIEARWNGDTTWTTLGLNTNGIGTFSGTLVNQSEGQGLLEVRFSNEILIVDTVSDVGIGDIYIIAGQSNASGRGLNLNNYTHGSLKASLFGNNDTWVELTDAVDSNSGQIDNVSSDGIAAGSPWPLIATSILASQNIPVAFVTTAKGGTRIQEWLPGADHTDATTLYGSMYRRINAVGGNVKAVLFFQGESDAVNGTSKTVYETRLNTFINEVETDFTGLKTMIGQIGHSNNDVRLNAVRAAQINVINTNSNALLGPTTYDIDLSDEGGDTLHFRSDTDMAEFARRWYKAIEKVFYNGLNGYGPVVVSGDASYNTSLNKITITFTDDTTPAINPASTVTAASFRLEDNGVAVAISSVAIVGDTVELIPSVALNTSNPITLSYAPNNSGIGFAIYDNENLPAENFYDLLIVDSSLGIIKSNFENKILVHPNPTKNNLSINLGNKYKTVNIKLTGINGELILSKNYYDSQLLDLNIKSVSSGIYFLTLKADNNSGILKVVKI